MVVTRLVVSWREIPPKEGCFTYQLEEICGNAAPFEPFGFANTGEIEASLRHRCHSGERLSLLLPIEEIRGRWRIFWKAEVRSILPNHHQLFRMFERQRT